jgi:hypothetical protein
MTSGMIRGKSSPSRATERPFLLIRRSSQDSMGMNKAKSKSDPLPLITSHSRDPRIEATAYKQPTCAQQQAETTWQRSTSQDASTIYPRVEVNKVQCHPAIADKPMYILRVSPLGQGHATPILSSMESVNRGSELLQRGPCVTSGEARAGYAPLFLTDRQVSTCGAEPDQAVRRALRRHGQYEYRAYIPL